MRAGLALILLNRLLDGLDGAVARATRLSDFGGYLDIVSDFVFYVSIPLGFALAVPANQIPALLLLASFTLTGISFLAFATLAAKRGVETDAHGRKSFFYDTGLAEGAETIAAFVLMALFPASFPAIALVYASLCLVTVAQRSVAARHLFHS
jgi:phosphatidylglycerophosphate synthase